MLDINFWKKYFGVYDVLNLLIPYQELLSDVCDALEIEEGDKILEAGCGSCNLVLKLKERGAEVVGLDNCQPALEVCKEKDSNLELVQASLIKELPFPNDYFDKIVCNNVLYTIAESKHKEVLRELERILKVGGLLVLVDPKKDWAPLKIYLEGIKKVFREGIGKGLKTVLLFLIPALRILYYNYVIKKEKEYYFFTLGEKKKLLEKEGFEMVVSPALIYADQCIINVARNVS